MGKYTAEAIESLLKKSPFNVPCYTVSLGVNTILLSLLDYLDHEKADQFRDDHKEMTPELWKEVAKLVTGRVPAFQRDNDKWPRARQQQYVWNVLNGLRGAPLSLYNTVNEMPNANCLIHDGLQRATALGDFFYDPTFYFDTSIGKISRDDLLDVMPRRRVSSNIVIQVNIYRFQDHVEACQHYIDINRGVTHSDADIKRAEDYIKAHRK